MPVLAVETDGANCLAAAVRAGHVVRLGGITSIAKSLGSLVVCGETLRLFGAHRSASSEVSDAEAVRGCLVLASENNLLVEPACGAAVGALLRGDAKQKFALEDGAPVLVIVCGGSLATVAQLAQWQDEMKLHA